jgi:hypothetical protein
MYAGQSHTDKIAKVREELEKKKAKALIVTVLDEVAWLFNLRGSDIDYNPGASRFIYASFMFSSLDCSILLICGYNYGICSLICPGRSVYSRYT